MGELRPFGVPMILKIEEKARYALKEKVEENRVLADHLTCLYSTIESREKSVALRHISQGDW